MSFDKVIDTKTGMEYKFVPEPKEKDMDAFLAPYLKNKPHKPIMLPYVDEVAIFLVDNPEILYTIVHYLKHYHTLTPVFCIHNRMYPMEFVLARIFNNLIRSVMRPDDNTLPDWKTTVRIALIKLEGKIYTSAGVN